MLPVFVKAWRLFLSTGKNNHAVAAVRRAFAFQPSSSSVTSIVTSERWFSSITSPHRMVAFPSLEAQKASSYINNKVVSTMKHFINLNEFDAETLQGMLKKAHELKAQKFHSPQLFQGMTLAMMFDKLSTRTRVSFDVAMKQLGGHTVVMNMQEMQIGGKESVESTAKTLSRFVDAIMIRMSDHATLEELAKHSDVPVINGMTNDSHPCQIMADLMTIEEKIGSIKGKKIAWFGDDNNVSKTYVQAAPIFEFDFVTSTPFNDVKPEEAAKDADVIITDTWVSLGQEGKDIKEFEPYQVNKQLMALAKPHAIFMHCLPIKEWEEVTEDVAKSPASVIFDEAENRLHAQKAILAYCLADAGVKI